MLIRRNTMGAALKTPNLSTNWISPGQCGYSAISCSTNRPTQCQPGRCRGRGPSRAKPRGDQVDQFVGKLRLGRGAEHLRGAVGGVDRKQVVVALEEVVPKLEAIAKTGYEERIYVRGDKTADYGTVMQVMARISAAGYRNLGLVTLQEQEIQ